MSETLSLESASYLREELLKIIKARYSLCSMVRYIPYDLAYIYKYYYRTRLSVMAMCDEIDKIDPDHPEGVNDGYFLNEIICNDTKRVPSEAACCAWLSIDSWRLDKEFPEDKGIPEDLSYGLVLSYPTPILRIARCLTGLSSEEKILEASVIQDCKNFAIDKTLKHASGYTREELVQTFRKLLT